VSVLTVLCRRDEVSADTPLRVEKDGVAYAVFVVGNSFYVTQDACTHGPGLLSEGYLDGEEIECPFHQGRFHIPSGRPAAPPCTEALRVWPAQAIDGRVCIDPSQ
jgi:ethylbenzene dioxygenase ferredoxin component